MKKILVTGGKGQLALSIKKIAQEEQELEFHFLDVDALDITDKAAVLREFETENYDFCINCAAFTQVDNAEKNEDRAYDINVNGPWYLAEACKIYEVVLIHISTDYVFNGTSKIPYNEDDATAPLSVYGTTKLAGEKIIKRTLGAHFIIRTSWLYSEYGNNFMKTMLRLGKEKTELSVVSDQWGTPTYAGDLAEVIVIIIKNNIDCYGLYHYSNEGEITWFDFAKEIFEVVGIDINLKPIPTEEYPTPARRPQYGVLNKDKIRNTMSITTKNWKDTLKIVLANKGIEI